MKVMNSKYEDESYLAIISKGDGICRISGRYGRTIWHIRLVPQRLHGRQSVSSPIYGYELRKADLGLGRVIDKNGRGYISSSLNLEEITKKIRDRYADVRFVIM